MDNRRNPPNPRESSATAALEHLRRALEAEPDNIELNRQAARSLTRLGQFDQAIIHWQRVERADPRDDEAPRSIAALIVEQGRRPVGQTPSPDAASDGGGPAAKPPGKDETGAARTPSGPLVLTLRQRLERAIVDHPEDETNYLKLADLLVSQQRFYEAQQTLIKAANRCGEPHVVERLEEVSILRANQQLEVARQLAAEKRTTDALDLVDQRSAELQQVEFEVLRARCARYPEKKSLRFQLGVQLKRMGKLREALEPLQAGLEVAEHRAVASLEIGEILQRYKQFPKALQCYRQAAQLAAPRIGSPISPHSEECRKRSLYRAGVLATDMGLLDSAKCYLAELVQTAGDYKDARSRLDKLAEIDEDL